MANYNVSVTQSIELQPSDISSGDPTTYTIDNPLGGSSYFVLETVPNSNGSYDSTSPKNCQGTYSLGAGLYSLVQDNFKAGVVVGPEGGILTFTPSNDITAATLRLRGTGA